MAPRHLDDETLAALSEGLLPAAEAARIRAELAGTREGAELLRVIDELPLLEAQAQHRPRAFRVPARATRAAIDLWPAEASPAAAKPNAANAVTRALGIAVRWLGEQLAPLADALAPEAGLAVAVRGEAARADAREEWRWRVKLGPVGLILDLEVEGPQQVALTVCPESPLPLGTLVRLTRGDETRALSTLGPAGTRVGALEIGEYALTLEDGRHEIGRLPIHLQP